MELLIVLIIVLSLLVLTLILSFVCFYFTFYSPKKKRNDVKTYPIPKDERFDEYSKQITEWIAEVQRIPYRKAEVKSFDSLTLRGRFYEYSPDAPIELMFHGYRGNSVRDLCGGVKRCFKLKRSVLVVDHRASGLSQGNVITFGINESKDCLTWIDYIINNINKNAKIILSGISMGAATVMTVSQYDLPKNVIGIIADCGYTSANEIIKKVVREMNLPPKLFYPFIKLGAIIFGRFNPDSTSPKQALTKCKLPILFIHGDNDLFVPNKMSEINYAVCTSPDKKLVTVKNAGHGMCLLADPDLYLKELDEFFKKYL